MSYDTAELREGIFELFEEAKRRARRGQSMILMRRAPPRPGVVFYLDESSPEMLSFRRANGARPLLREYGCASCRELFGTEKGVAAHFWRTHGEGQGHKGGRRREGPKPVRIRPLEPAPGRYPCVDCELFFGTINGLRSHMQRTGHMRVEFELAAREGLDNFQMSVRFRERVDDEIRNFQTR